MLNCRGPLGNSKSEREGLKMNTCNDKYYVKYRRVPSPLNICTTDAELASYTKREVGSRPYLTSSTARDQQLCRQGRALPLKTADVTRDNSSLTGQQ